MITIKAIPVFGLGEVAERQTHDGDTLWEFGWWPLSKLKYPLAGSNPAHPSHYFS